MVCEDGGDSGSGSRTYDRCDHHAIGEDMLRRYAIRDVVELGWVIGGYRAGGRLNGALDTFIRRVVCVGGRGA